MGFQREKEINTTHQGFIFQEMGNCFQNKNLKIKTVSNAVQTHFGYNVDIKKN